MARVKSASPGAAASGVQATTRGGPTAQKSAPPPTKNVDVIRGLYEAYTRGEPAGVIDALHRRIEWHEGHEPVPPPAGGGVLYGRDAVVKEVLDGTKKNWSELAVRPESFIADGDRVVAIGSFSGRAKSTGMQVEAPCVQVWRLQGGKAVRMDNYTDTARLSRALLGSDPSLDEKPSREEEPSAAA